MKVSSVIRKLTVLLALSSLALTVMNCSKKDDPSPQAQIVGTWKISNFYFKQGNSAETDLFPVALLQSPCLANVTFTFNSDGKATASIPNNCEDEAEQYVPDIDQTSYEVKDNSLILTSGNSSDEVPISFQDGKMFWTFTDTDGGVTTVIRIGFTKQ
jgi:hypothetical protein